MSVCETCGAWVRSERQRCPWCGAATISAASDTATELLPIQPAGAGWSDEGATGAEPAYGAAGGAAFEDELTAAYQHEAWTPPPPDLPSRGRRFWLRAFSAALLTILLAMLVLGGLGVYRGLNDRRAQEKRQAISYFEQGNERLEAQQYELAIASYREALRLEPNFEAAAYMLDRTIEQSEQGDTSNSGAPAAVTGGAATATPPATPLSSNMDEMFDQAIRSLAAKDWELAAANFDTLGSQAPSYKPQEVADGLFKARMEAGKAALAEENLSDALRHFDHALAVRPDDEEAQRLRWLTSAYRAGQRAYEGQKWESAAGQLRTVYLTDPTFLQTKELLALAHQELGQEFAEREIWCDAAQQYRSSLAVVTDAQVRSLASQASDLCNQRAAAATSATDEGSTQGSSDELEETGATPTITETPEESNAVATPTIDEVSPTIPPTATLPPRATATLAPTRAPVPGVAYQLAGPVGLTDGCAGNYIQGTIRAEDGAPLAGVTVLASDEWGNSLVGTSKPDPLGQYDIPISGEVTRYQVQVVSGEQMLSAPVTITRDEGVNTLCFVLNWQKLR